MYNFNYNPDILSCLASLSNDEVFTPPVIVNIMLDSLPDDLWSNPNLRVLDPCVKSGVFLREIAKRLIKGLEKTIPDLQERVDHVFHNQLYGIALTELTALLSRRSVYCSKMPNGKYSVSKFEDQFGNIKYQRIEHIWHEDHCICCGASRSEYDRPNDLETHAYEFIHLNKKKFDELINMHFDLIIGNPPYHLKVGVKKDNYSINIYHKFVEMGKRLSPKYLSMIIPARWYAGGRGLEEFRNEMIHDKRLVELHDFPNSTDCFPGVDLAGGVCYFLWERDKNQDCKIVTHKNGEVDSVSVRPLCEKGIETFIRQNEAIPILHKVQEKGEKSFSCLVSAQTPFGIISSFSDYTTEPFPGAIKYYSYGKIGYISRDKILRNTSYIKEHKVYISAAYGERGKYPYYFLGKPFYGEPNSCCSQTYLVIGPFKNQKICENVMSYMKTKFFRFMVMLKKNTQHNMGHVFGCVPIQDFSKSYTDQELYKKYNLKPEEIDFIESMVRPMI